MQHLLNQSIVPFRRDAQGYEGYEDPNGRVMFLLKNLYGSTTAPFQFNCLLSNSLLAQGFTPNEYDCCLFTKMVDNSLMLVLCY